MNNTFYFLRHGETKVDKSKPISKWVLSEKGQKQAKELAKEGIFNDIDLIFSSTEEKAYQTALPIANSLGKEITKLEEIVELNRNAGGFIDDYEKIVKLCLSNPDESFNNWETANSALMRFSKKIEELDQRYENKKVLVVGHSFTINMYFAKLLGILNKIYERLSMNTFADWGIVRNKNVVKDITNSF